VALRHSRTVHDLAVTSSPFPSEQDMPVMSTHRSGARASGPRTQTGPGRSVHRGAVRRIIGEHGLIHATKNLNRSIGVAQGDPKQAALIWPFCSNSSRGLQVRKASSGLQRLRHVIACCLAAS